MDKKDRKILYELTKNARVGTKKLAKSVGLSESSIYYRIKKLYDDKIIIGSYVVVDYSKLGYCGYRIYITLTNTTKEKEKEIIQWLVNNDKVAIVGKGVTGIDLGIQSWLKSSKEFDVLVSDIKKKFGQYIGSFRVDLYLKTYFFNRNYLIDENKDRSFFCTGHDGVMDYDDTDINLLTILSGDARITKKEIAKKLNLSLKTINNRLKNLEKNKIIMGYSININRSKLGYEYYKLGLTLNSNVDYDKLLSVAANMDNVVYVDYSLSDFDFEPNIEVRNYQELSEIIDKFKQEFGGLKHVFMYSLEKYHKLKFI